MLLGAHVSMSGGLDQAISRGDLIGAEAIQTFASPPRQLAAKSLTQEEIDKYKQAREKSQIKLHVFHGVYLINLANEKPAYVDLCVDSLVSYQEVAGKLGVIGTIFHVGSHKGLGFETVANQVAKAIAKVTKRTPDGVKLFIENAAGHSGTIGQNIEEIKTLFNLVETQGGEMTKLGLCLDTQHAFASGVDGRDINSLNQFLDEVDATIGLEKVDVIHTNDSIPEYGSHKDRHANLGEGELGENGMKNWLRHPKLKDKAFILEVPGREKAGPARMDMETLNHYARGI